VRVCMCVLVGVRSISQNYSSGGIVVLSDVFLISGSVRDLEAQGTTGVREWQDFPGLEAISLSVEGSAPCPQVTPGLLVLRSI
jgi:hypothetical protein